MGLRPLTGAFVETLSSPSGIWSRRSDSISMGNRKPLPPQVVSLLVILTPPTTRTAASLQSWTSSSSADKGPWFFPFLRIQPLVSPFKTSGYRGSSLNQPLRRLLHSPRLRKWITTVISPFTFPPTGCHRGSRRIQSICTFTNGRAKG